MTLYTMDDTAPEDDEEIYVYISPQTEGVRVAMPDMDDDRMVRQSALQSCYIML